ncbi:MAG: MFS transporter [Terrimicrobiaceae bacterium]
MKEGMFRCGSLIYTREGLILLFAWLLWGDFCFQLMETIVPSILPLKLRMLDAPNWLIATIMTTLPSILNTTICPWVSFKSDRYRSRWGRRIPFIISTLPFLTVFLLLLGWSEHIGVWIHRHWFSEGGISSTQLILLLIGVFMVGFQFFNMFVSSVFWYLFNDVVPIQFMGRFLGLFRVVAGLKATLYNFLIFRYAESHMPEIFTGVSLLYFFGFGVMCLMIKEGDYPPPPEHAEGRAGFLGQIRTFAVECYSLRFYWDYYLFSMFISLASCIGTFSIFLQKDIGLDLAKIGQISGVVTLVMTCLTYPAGVLVDRFHPLRVLLWVKIIVVALAPLNLIWLFFDFQPQTVFMISLGFSMFLLPFNVLTAATDLPTQMRLFPKERFGQFCSANALLRSVVTMFGGVLAGGFLDLTRWACGGSNFGYRFIPMWTIPCVVAALLCLIRMYRRWEAAGGDLGYHPPMPAPAVASSSVDGPPR